MKYTKNMTDQKTFPNVEPPPHPESAESKNPSLMAVMTPEPVQTVAGGPQPAGTISPQEVKSLPKKGLPKILLLVVGVVVLIIVIFVVASILKSRGPVLVGTKGEITWWSKEEESVVSPLIEEFQRQNPNVRVKYVKQSEKDYRERLTSSLAGGQGPDVFEIHNSWVPMYKNYLSPMPSGVMSTDDFAKSFYPVIVKDFSTDKGIVGLPLEYDALTLYINEEIFTSALKSPPKTWDDLRKLSTDLTSKPNRLILQSGVAMGLTDNVDHWPELLALMILQNGADLSKPQSDYVRDAVTFYLRFSKTDNVWDITLPASTVAFARNKVAMYFAPTRRADEIVKLNPNLKFKTVPLPQLQKENPSDPDLAYSTYWAQGVWNKSKNSEIGWSFLKFMSTPEALQKMNSARKANNLLERAYPRPEMAILHKDDEVLGSIISLAPEAKSWYLADQTFDGPTGINSQMKTVFAETIAAAQGKGDFTQALKNLPGKINQVIAKYNTKR